MYIELILVYNADSGFFNIIKDGLHKIVAPSTYQCRLCTLTYGTIRMKNEWKAFIDKLKVPAQFMHRDEFLSKLRSHPHNVRNLKFPAVFLEKEGKISLLITHNEFDKLKTLDALMRLITEKLSNL